MYICVTKGKTGRRREIKYFKRKIVQNDFLIPNRLLIIIK